MSSLEQQVDWFLAALREHESNSNYHSRSSVSSASGAYQYIDSTWNNYGGYAHAWQAPPEVQDRRAHHDVLANWNHYHDWGKVAAAHFYPALAGTPSQWDTRPGDDSNPTIQEYVDHVLGLMNDASDGKIKVSSSGGGSGVESFGGGGSGDKQTAHELAGEYGFSDAFFGLDPSLKHLIQQAVAGQWTTEKFQAELKGTDWYRTHSAAQREWLQLKTSDPTEAGAEADTLARQIMDQAGQLGAILTPDRAHQIARDMLYRGQTAAEIPHRLAGFIKVDPKSGHFLGQADALNSQLEKLAGDYGVPVSFQTRRNAVRNILTGKTTIDNLSSYLKDQAKSLYPSIGTQIDQGMTVRDVVDPYVQQMAQTLEIDPSEIGLHDRHIRQVLQYQAPDAKDGQFGLMPLWQAERQLFNDPRYGHTDGAKNSVFSFLRSLGQNLGRAI